MMATGVPTVPPGVNDGGGWWGVWGDRDGVVCECVGDDGVRPDATADPAAARGDTRCVVCGVCVGVVSLSVVTRTPTPGDTTV